MEGVEKMEPNFRTVPYTATSDSIGTRDENLEKEGVAAAAAC